MLQTGSLIGNYQIEALLGQGGMGVVYEAIQLSLHRRVALKVITPELSRNDRFQERFRREARSQAALDHPHVVTVHDFGDADGQLYISMQLIKGPSLKDLITRGELDLHRVIRILRPIADALDAAHDAGMIHRDFKPQNILIGSRDHAYLADFGLTQALGQPGLTRTGQFVGTLDYIAPEQIHGRPATRRSDVYAFGAVLFECLTGRVPYERESDAAILFAHVSEPPPRPSEVRPDVPRQVDDVLAHAMAKDPEQRVDSATAVMDELEAATGAGTRLPPPPPTEIARRTSTGERPQERSASTTFGGRLIQPQAGQTLVDRPPSASQVGPRPTERRSYRKPITITLAVVITAAAAGSGFALSDRGPSTQERAHVRYVEAVDDTVDRLGLTYRAERRALADAATVPDQIDAVGRLERTFEQASDDLEAIKAPPADAARHRRLVQRVDQLATRFGTMRQAAETNKKGIYDRTAESIGRSEAALQKEIDALRGALIQ
ncbi:serine/threonine protein kinase [Solirubrobacter sp. CPCC 204708]|uniref:non-specific serine/threonine protein kinase n=1 Tax=Solirubrobacter deserti TaxID=2282478 RepID=A0ABT4RIA5_9ACTN|nr:serine/threonine-protein kinase [Solirubrobacter deserti]MBE2318828.1 serine/threonine protein kinase [Solirubrobacter deserti]MDA0138208.1 protein kinase [Solirubrobacter deserti]